MKAKTKQLDRALRQASRKRLPVAVRNARDELLWFVRACRVPRLRTMAEFAAEEIVLPEGPYEGHKMRREYQPAHFVFFDLVDQGHWNRVFVTGTVQGGKSLCSYVVPILYHIFERKETVIFAGPKVEVCRDKWKQEIEPVIRRSRYAEFLPDKGMGSRGGNFDAIKFKHGPTLKLMSGSGGDDSRSSFTSRVVVMTEIDKMDVAGEASREADPIRQLEARTEAFAEQKRIYGECTVSIEEGRIWREVTGGTDTRLVMPCVHCGQHVLPDREHLAGFEACENAKQAEDAAAFHCPECGEAYTDAERRAMVQNVHPLHRGQTIGDDGASEGPLPETRTLGFRWSAFHNLFWSAGHIGAGEWKASQNPDDQSLERERCQFVWVRPWLPPTWNLSKLDPKLFKKRFGDQKLIEGMVPANVEFLTIGIDIGKWLCHYVALAFCRDKRIHVVEHGRKDVASDDLGFETALLVALRELRDSFAAGFPVADGTLWHLDRVLIDRRYGKEVVYRFCDESRAEFGELFLPAIGFGMRDSLKRRYNAPRGVNKTVHWIGEGCHVQQREQMDFGVEVACNADHWKTWTHNRATTPSHEPGAMQLYWSRDVNEHTSYAAHLANETKKIEFVPGIGEVETWEAKGVNHWFDATYLGSVAARLCGWQLIDPVAATPAVGGQMVNPTNEGRPYLITERM